MKKSFYLHCDNLAILEELSNDQRGELFFAIYKYHIGEEIEMSPIVKIAFFSFRNQFIRDEEKYEAVCERNKNNIGKRWDTRNTTGKTGINKIPDDTRNTDKDKDKDKDNKNIKKEIKKEKKIFLSLPQFPLVKISGEEMEQLEKQFGKDGANKKIKALFLHIGSKGDKYKNHYLTILNWDRRDNEQNGVSGKVGLIANKLTGVHYPDGQIKYKTEIEIDTLKKRGLLRNIGGKVIFGA